MTLEVAHALNTPIYSKRIILALRKIMQRIDHHSHNLDKQFGITVPQLGCLYEIYEKGTMTLSVLSKNVHLSTSTLVGIIDRLEEKGFVKRSRGTVDRRLSFIEMTAKGIEFIQTSPQLLHNRLDVHFKQLSEEDQILIANSLDILVGILKNT
ncbi:MAG TPA: MarR family transcriptional regulator [Legionellaceae bacterium]|nr:MarR family transcriptional regulator [Legionellaceae bacterium]